MDVYGLAHPSYIYTSIFYSIYIYNISMYRFFFGIAGRKDVGKSLITYEDKTQDVLPPSFSWTNIALSRARMIIGLY